MSIRNSVLLGIGGLMAGSVFSAIDWLVFDTVRYVAFLHIPLYGILGVIVGTVLDRLRDNNQRMHRSYRSSLDALANAVQQADSGSMATRRSRQPQVQQPNVKGDAHEPARG